MKRKIFSKLLMGAFLIASVSMFVSCKDYDDDIQKNAADIAALKTQLASDIASAKSELTAQLQSVNSQITTLKTEINNEIANLKTDKASKAELAALQGDIDELKGLLQRVSVLEAQIAKLATIEDLNKKANQSDLDKLVGDVAALTGKIPTDASIKAIAEAVVTQMAVQQDAFDAYKSKIDGELAKLATKDEIKNFVTKDELKGLDLDALKEGVKKLQELMNDTYKQQIDDLLAKELLTKTEIDAAIESALTEKFDELNDKITKEIGPQLSALEVFVNKKLTSIVLKPNFYWEGIEGIEAPYIWQTPVFEHKDGTYEFDYTLTNAPAGKNIVHVSVDGYMGWAGTYPADKNNRELAKFVFEGPAASHANFPVYAVDEVDDYYADGHEFLTYDMGNADNRKIKKVDIAYGAEAYYNLNPNIAVLDGAKIGFFEQDAPVYTRAEGLKINPTVIADDVKNANGLLKVPFTVDWENVTKYFVDWTNSQTLDWEGLWYGQYYADMKETWSKLWYLDKNNNQVSGSDDSDSYYDGEYFVYGANLPFVALNIAFPANEKREAYSVSSDWAVVVPALYQIVALADNAPEAGTSLGTFTVPTAYDAHEIRNNHLYETVGYDGAIDGTKQEPGFNDWEYYGAIPMPATHSVKYDSEIDLLQFVNTHYNYLTFAQYGQSSFDGVLDKWTDAVPDGGELFKKLGLTYKFSIVNYRVGKEETSESAHCTLEESKTFVDLAGNKIKSVVKPRSVDKAGNTITDANATREAIDREPLIRVDLMHGNDIIRYGYIKLRISDKDAAQEKDYEVAIELNKELYMNCGDEVKIKWSEVEALILAKLGTEGLDKKEFERQYKLDVYGNYDFMPFLDPSKVTDEDGNVDTDMPGPLYTYTWQAKRYYRKDGAAEFDKLVEVSADKYGTALDEYTPNGIDAWTLTNNHFGEVWYTPHDNSTEGHNWDEQTNVLIWNFFPGDGTDFNESRTVYVDAGKDNDGNQKGNLEKETAGNMNAAKYAKLMSLTEAKYSNNATSQKAVSTTVRFVNKITGRYLYVTLTVPTQKIHFAYADVNNRVLYHWYDYKQGYKTETPDTIEVYANVPTPAEIDRATGVTVNGFTKNLTEYWLNQDIKKSVTFYNSGKFDKFAGKSEVTFRFRLPEQGVNADFSADNNGCWTAPGASGITWTVKLNADKNAIVAVKKGSQNIDPVTICTLTRQGVIHWMGRTEEGPTADNGCILDANKENVNEPANDILNYIGMYDNEGNLQRNKYLTKQQNKTFAAYVEVYVHNDCYDPFVGKNYFNVRFLRPINVWPTATNWIDAYNQTMVYDIWKLINIRDWRTYAVVMNGQKQKLDDGNITYEGIYADGEKASVPYSFYNIKNLYVERNKIKSDAYLPVSKRGVTPVNDLLTIDEIPSLTGKNNGVIEWEYLKIVKAGTNPVNAGKAALGKAESTASGDLLAYTNNGGVVDVFHIYVPISIVYSHGAAKPWTQTVWATITVDPTVGSNQ
jgi:hypothetical protein